MMLSYRVATCGILASLCVWTGQASAGWIIEHVVKGGGEGAKHHVLVQANQMKTLIVGANGKPLYAFILDLNTDAITQVDYEKGQYVTTTIQEFGKALQGAQQGASDQMARAMKEMQEQMKQMPPEQRKMIEEMMRSRMPQSEPAPQDCREPRIEIRKTGQQATVAGYPAVRYDVLADGKLESELWISKGITAWQELDSQKLERFSAEMARLAPRCSPAIGRHRLPGKDPAWKLAGEGFPVRTVHRDGEGATVEVVKADSRTIPLAEFQPPAGFVKKTLREMMGP